jgi:hypothetical protein
MSTKLILNVFMTVWVQNSYSKFLWLYEYRTCTQSFYECKAWSPEKPLLINTIIKKLNIINNHSVEKSAGEPILY